MKPLFVFVLGMIYVTVFGQKENVVFDAEKWHPPYVLEIPEKWGVERFPIPIEFAPAIPYKGVEDIRFTPGWGDENSKEYWSYAFLWYLEGSVAMDAATIEKNLQLYYTGLIGRNIEKRKIPAEKVFTPRTTFKLAKTAAGDQRTFSGTIYMLDYMAQKPMTLNCIVHLKSCNKQKDKTFLLYEVSPQALTGPVWQQFNKLNTGFRCEKTGDAK